MDEDRNKNKPANKEKILPTQAPRDPEKNIAKRKNINIIDAYFFCLPLQKKIEDKTTGIEIITIIANE